MCTRTTPSTTSVRASATAFNVAIVAAIQAFFFLLMALVVAPMRRLWRLARAALRRQLQTVLGGAAAQVDIRTFHSFGLRVIRAWSEELGFGPTPPAVYGRDDARAVLREAARELGLAVTAEHASRDQLDPWAISLAQLDHALEHYRLGHAREVQTMTADDSDVDLLDATVLADLCAVYERRLQDYSAVD